MIAIFLLILAGAALIWQVIIGIGAMIIVTKGGRVTTFGILPGILFVIFLALGLALL